MVHYSAALDITEDPGSGYSYRTYSSLKPEEKQYPYSWNEENSYINNVEWDNDEEVFTSKVGSTTYQAIRLVLTYEWSKWIE